MDIVDAQVHIAPVGKAYGPGPLEAGSGIIDSTLDAMNAVGIRSVIIDEYWFWVAPPKPMQILPGNELANGAWRAAFPIAQLAGILHPDRFCAFVRVDRRDPQLESVMRVLASTPQVRAFRSLAVWNPEEARQFMGGGYDRVFEIAQDLGLPMCMAIQGFVEYLPQYAKKFPKLQFIVDHWGMGIPFNTAQRPEADLRRSISLEYLDEIMKLAEHPNIALKIGHAQMHFKAKRYPFEEVRPHLRRAIKAFGADRLTWGSDKTIAQPPFSWMELLNSLKDDPELSQEEKELILGKNARRLYNWPAPAA